MTAFATISNLEIAPGQPVASSTATKMRDNPVAIAEGDNTAPSVRADLALSAPASEVGKAVVVGTTNHPDGAGRKRMVYVAVPHDPVYTTVETDINPSTDYTYTMALTDGSWDITATFEVEGATGPLMDFKARVNVTTGILVYGTLTLNDGGIGIITPTPPAWSTPFAAGRLAGNYLNQNISTQQQLFDRGGSSGLSMWLWIDTTTKELKLKFNEATIGGSQMGLSILMTGR